MNTERLRSRKEGHAREIRALECNDMCRAALAFSRPASPRESSYCVYVICKQRRTHEVRTYVEYVRSSATSFVVNCVCVRIFL